MLAAWLMQTFRWPHTRFVGCRHGCRCSGDGKRCVGGRVVDKWWETWPQQLHPVADWIPCSHSRDQMTRLLSLICIVCRTASCVCRWFRECSLCHTCRQYHATFECHNIVRQAHPLPISWCRLIDMITCSLCSYKQQPAWVVIQSSFFALLKIHTAYLGVEKPKF